MSIKEVTATSGRLEQLKALAALLADNIDICADAKALPSLAKQYRETIREIEEIEGAVSDGDEISEILTARKADGKSGAVRKNRAGVSNV